MRTPVKWSLVPYISLYFITALFFQLHRNHHHCDHNFIFIVINLWSQRHIYLIHSFFFKLKYGWFTIQHSFWVYNIEIQFILGGLYSIYCNNLSFTHTTLEFSWSINNTLLCLDLEIIRVMLTFIWNYCKLLQK